MVFSSLVFLLFFFVVLMIVQYFCKEVSTKNKALLFFSLVYFAWGGLQYLVLVLIMAAVNWAVGKQLYGTENEKKRKALLAVGLIIDVGVMAAFRAWRLLPFGGEETTALRYIMPMGLMFYGLQLVSYLVDIYRGNTKAQKSYFKVLLYTSMFLYAAGGPIVRHESIRKQLNRRTVKSGDMSQGILRFSIGLAKKVVLADSCGAMADRLIGTTAESVAAAPALSLWFGAAFFMLQLFLDLSAYADMAIGMGLMLGFHLPENFDYPYAAASLKDFWHRWNITVVNFFRDYIYAPLGGSSLGKGTQLVNLVIAWLIFGLWHGSSVTFMLWAVWCLAMLLIERAAGSALSHGAVGHVWVIVTMFIGFVIYRFTDPGMLVTALKGMIGLNHNGLITGEIGILLGRHILLLVISILAATPIFRVAENMLSQMSRQRRGLLYTKAVADVVIPAILLIISLMAMAGSNAASFLYFQI